MNFVTKIIAASLVAFASLAHADTRQGNVNSIELTSGGYDMRVTLTGAGAQCSNGGAYMYLNEADANYKGFLSALLLARAIGSSVTIYSSPSGSGCKITNVVVWNYN